MSQFSSTSVDSARTDPGQSGRAPFGAEGTPLFAGGPSYDEMVDGVGSIRPAWRPLIGALHSMAKSAFEERVMRVHRQHEDISIAYRIEPDQRAAANRRPFDLLPMALDAEEWSALEAGLAQRARLLDRLLADIYGERRMVAEGVLPAALVYANPRFQRACSGVRPAAGSYLHAYAADLVRQADGSWRVLADRLQAPAGIGFALQNRNILSRTVPELFRAQPVRRIEPFFDLWRDALAALSPRRDAPPRVAVMTPGPFSAAFFEHVYLARQINATLVEGADLTLRDGHVFVKTLGVLQPVDVILRFLDDESCDPLEIKSASAIGAPGLLQAVRAGTVGVVNALGAGAAETPALMPYLPRLAEALLDEKLQLQSAETEWLGAPGAVERLPALLDSGWNVRPAFTAWRDEQGLAAVNRDTLLDEVRRRPYLHVAEPEAHRSMIPIWTPDGFIPQPVTLRVFLVKHGEKYVAMPGGFAQVPHRSTGAVAPLRQLAMSKDVWVSVGDEDGSTPTHRTPAVGGPIRRPVDELRSRTADNLFWLGRYMERLDVAARLMRAAAQRLAVDSFGPGQRQDLQYLARMLVDANLMEAGAAEMMPDSAGFMLALSVGGVRGRALDDLFRAVRRIAQALRDRLSNDLWTLAIGKLREAREQLEVNATQIDGLISGLDNLVGVVASFSGMASENMTRGSGWRFLDIGCRVERGMYASSVLKEVLNGRPEDVESGLHLALELCDCSITYRSRYLSTVQVGPVLDLILVDEANPRGMVFQVQRICDHLRDLAASFARLGRGPEQALAAQVLARLREADVETMGETLEQTTRRRLVELLDEAQQQLMALSEAITRAYFSHVGATHTTGYGMRRP